MIAWIVKLLTGGSVAGGAGPWLLLAGVLVIGGGGFAAGDYVRGVIDAPIIAQAKQHQSDAEKATAQCQAIHEKGRADSAEGVIAAILNNAKVAAGIVDDLAKKATARRQSLDQLLKDIANAPPSKLCGGSAAELSFRRSVQPHSAAAAP